MDESESKSQSSGLLREVDLLFGSLVFQEYIVECISMVIRPAIYGVVES